MQPGPESGPVGICPVTSSVSRSITATRLSPRSAAYAREPLGSTSTAFGARSNRVISVRAAASSTSRLLPLAVGDEHPLAVRRECEPVGVLQHQLESLDDRLRGDVDDGDAAVVPGRGPDLPAVGRQVDPFRELPVGRNRGDAPVGRTRRHLLDDREGIGAPVRRDNGVSRSALRTIMCVPSCPVPSSQSTLSRAGS